MARIVVDLEKLRIMESGLGQFCWELSHALLRHRRPEEELTYFVPPDRLDVFKDAPVTQKPVRRLLKRHNIHGLRKKFHRFFPGPQYDLWHITNQTSKYEPWSPNVPVLLTIHDLNFLREKPRHTIDVHVRELQRRVDRAARIAVISNFVANEVRQWIELHGKGVDVVYNGVTTAPDRDIPRPASAPNRPILFSVGCMSEKKNFHTLVQMLAYMPEFALVIAGINNTAYASYVRRCIVKCGVGDRTILTGPISDDERQWYYRNCVGFVFPSLTEGFGLPPIEAMQAGKPTFLSTLTSLPEIGGDAAFYWTDFEPQAMASVVRRGLERASMEPGFAHRVRLRSKRFCWDLAAQQYWEIYREMLADRAHQGPQAPAAPQQTAA